MWQLHPLHYGAGLPDCVFSDKRCSADEVCTSIPKSKRDLKTLSGPIHLDCLKYEFEEEAIEE